MQLAEVLKRSDNIEVEDLRLRRAREPEAPELVLALAGDGVGAASAEEACEDAAQQGACLGRRHEVAALGGLAAALADFGRDAQRLEGLLDHFERQALGRHVFPLCACCSDGASVRAQVIDCVLGCCVPDRRVLLCERFVQVFGREAL